MDSEMGTWPIANARRISRSLGGLLVDGQLVRAT